MFLCKDKDLYINSFSKVTMFHILYKIIITQTFFLNFPIFIVMFERLILWLVPIIVFISCRTSKETLILIEDAASVKEVFVYPDLQVRHKIDSLFLSGGVFPDNSNEAELEDVSHYYEQKNFQPLWNTREKVTKGIAMVRHSHFHGLQPTDYFIDEIDNLLQEGCYDKPDPLGLAYIDIYLTSAVKRLSKHCVLGKLHPKKYFPTWNGYENHFSEFNSVFTQFIVQNKVDSLERGFRPQLTAYEAMYNEMVRLWFLKTSYFDYKSMDYPGQILRRGDTSLFVVDLKYALISRGYMNEEKPDDIFNDTLESAVKSFQRIHGLNPDGVPGPKTFFFLSWTIEDYQNVLRVNMERLRWYNNFLPDIRIEVNIPSADLVLSNADTILFKTKVIVGKFDNQTPVITSNIDYLVFNPCWTVPQSIAAKKFLKRMQRDTTFLDKRNMFITQNGREVDHDSIDFKQYTENNFPFKIYQRSSNDNALGKVKFMFPNSYSVYLHDTPGKSLFARDIRTYSHGCVRVQDAEYLAKLILSDIDKNTKPVDYYYKKGFPIKVYLKNEIPLYINYFTCRFNEELNEIQYFKDIYNYDHKMLSDLQMR